ncbi:MAG TPA: cache domain-containing protein, partial [Anaerolineales bacterium]|nr:cache domain-containing protein [Anaerolineales bacterium]
MKIFRNLTLHKRGFLLISAGLIVLFVIQTVQKVAILNTLTRMILEERLSLAYTVAQDLDNDLNDLLDGLEHFSTNPNMRLMDNDMEPEREELQAFHDPDSYQYIFILDKEGKVLLTEPFLPDVVGGTTMVNCPHVKKVLDTGESGVACINHALTPLRPVIAPMVPIYDDQGIVAGVLGVAIDPASPSFSGLLEEALHGQEVHAEIIDENGTVLAHTQGKNLFRLNDHANLFIPLVENKQPLMDIQLLEEDGEKSEMVIAFAPLSTVSWGVVIEQPKAELLAPVYEATRQTLYFSVAAILTALLVVWVSIESIVKPIKRLSVASQSLANGDFGTSLEITGNGEIAELGQGFEAMRRKLESWNAEMEAAVRKRTYELSKYKTILDNLNEQVVVIDDNYCIINANQPFLQATGLQYPDVIGRHCHEISHRSPIPCWQGKNGGQNCPVLKVWQNGHSARSLHKHYDAAGMPIWIELTASPLLNDIGGLTAVIEVIRDITIEKRHSTLLTNILELSTQLATMNEEGPLLKTLVTRGALLAESSTFTVMLIDEKRDEAYILAENGLPDGSTGLRVPLKLPLFRPFMESGKPIIIPDIDRYAPETRTILVRRDIQSFFVYPIVRKNGRPIGFITISKLTP